MANKDNNCSTMDENIDKSGTQWSRAGSFLNKPEGGWVHISALLAPDAGISYDVRYIGSIQIKDSISALDFETKTSLAREAITKVAEAAGLKTASKKKTKLDTSYISKMLGYVPHKQYSGLNVQLTITTESVNLMVTKTGDIMADHPIHLISFAVLGEHETSCFLSYIAKDPEYERICHVLDCGESAEAEEIFSTICQAFEIRTKQYLKKTDG